MVLTVSLCGSSCKWLRVFNECATRRKLPSNIGCPRFSPHNTPVDGPDMVMPTSGSQLAGTDGVMIRWVSHGNRRIHVVVPFYFIPVWQYIRMGISSQMVYPNPGRPHSGESTYSVIYCPIKNTVHQVMLTVQDTRRNT